MDGGGDADGGEESEKLRDAQEREQGGPDGKGTWSFIKAGKIQSHRESQTITRAQ